MNSPHANLSSREAELFQEHRNRQFRRTDRMFIVLLVFQWLAGLGVAIWISPLTWAGRVSGIHPHVWAALGLGSIITLFPVGVALIRPGDALTRHVIAAGQMLWSALLIHLTGGRIETHFHVFGSLAFLAFYRDWRVLLTGTVVVAADHYFRGAFWPESVYGVIQKSSWRWLEHAGWVVFEDVVLLKACLRGVGETREIAARQAEIEASSGRKYEALVNSVDGIVWEAEAATMKFTLVSPQAELMLGYPASRWIESPGFWKSVLHPDDRGPVEEALARKAASEKFFDLEYRVLTSAGKILWARDAIAVIEGEGGTRLLRGVLTDITEKKRVESMKNEFISTVSHELRTPLTSIRGSLGLIASGITGPLLPKTKNLLDIACKNSERLVNLVNDILDISKIESGKLAYKLKILDLPALVAKAVEANRAYAQSFDVSLEVSDGLRSALLVADEDRLIQVLTNLISNACKFSPKKGVVRILLGRMGGRLRVAVEDQGAGIPEEFKARIFQKFAQADASDGRQRQGTGLGLSISKAIVEQLGGEISFASAPGKGTTFEIEFPEKASPAAPPSVPSDRPALLICEDDADIALILKATLDCAGYDADIAGSAGEARKLLRLRRYAGMTLDLGLPDENGISLLRSLRQEEETRQLPVIIVSAYIDEARQTVSGDAFGIIDWIEKPLSQARLEAALERAIRAGGDKRPRILHVEDDADIHEVVKMTLADVADVKIATSLAAAKAEVRKEKYDLLMLDVGLPDGSGLELVPALRSSANATTPVILFSACQVSQMAAQSVARTLVKSKTSNEELVATIKSILGSASLPKAADLVHAEA